MSTLQDRMDDFQPLIIVERDGVEVQIPIAEWMADQL
jgi:hypothetical protein